MYGVGWLRNVALCWVYRQHCCHDMAAVTDSVAAAVVFVCCVACSLTSHLTYDTHSNNNSGIKCLAIKSWMRGTHKRHHHQHIDDDSDDVGDWDD